MVVRRTGWEESCDGLLVGHDEAMDDPLVVIQANAGI